MTREEQAVKAQASIDAGYDVRDRLLSELDQLERTLHGMRRTVEAMPTDKGPQEPDRPASGQRKWKLW